MKTRQNVNRPIYLMCIIVIAVSLWWLFRILVLAPLAYLFRIDSNTNTRS